MLPAAAIFSGKLAGGVVGDLRDVAERVNRRYAAAIHIVHELRAVSLRINYHDIHIQ